MDWNENQIRLPFLSRPADQSSFTFLYNYDPHYPPVACTEMKHPMITQMQHAVVPTDNFVEMKKKKKRLTSEQLESLEMSFQEEIKLEPDRKMKLALELGLQPRQVAVWFQNRRARWKAKELERLYDSLKHQLDHVSREKHKLQEEVMVLRAIIQKEEATKKRQVSAGYTDISGEETVESTSVVIPVQSSNYRPQPRGTIAIATTNDDQYRNQNQNQNQNENQNIGDGCNYVFNVGNYNPPYWPSGGVMPSYPS